MLDNEKNGEIINWNYHGNGFLIKDISQFSEKLLPLYFKHSNFSSFIRQLNLYSFNKVRRIDNGNHCEFIHEHFRRINPLFTEIQRKKRKNPLFSEVSNSYSSNFSENKSNFSQDFQSSNCLALQVIENQKVFRENQQLFSQVKEKMNSSNVNVQNFIISQISSLLTKKSSSIFEEDNEMNQRKSPRYSSKDRIWKSDDDPFSLKKSPKKDYSKFELIENEDRIQLYNPNKLHFPFEEKKSIFDFGVLEQNSKEEPFFYNENEMEIENDYPMFKFPSQSGSQEEEIEEEYKFYN